MERLACGGDGKLPAEGRFEIKTPLAIKLRRGGDLHSFHVQVIFIVLRELQVGVVRGRPELVAGEDEEDQGGRLVQQLQPNEGGTQNHAHTKSFVWREALPPNSECSSYFVNSAARKRRRLSAASWGVTERLFTASLSFRRPFF